MRFLFFLFLCLLSPFVFSQETSGQENNIIAVENVPIYKGCENETSNVNLKQCMSNKVAQLFQDNFNTTLPEESKLKPGIVSIYVIFKISQKGQVIDVESRAPEMFLEDEAKRVTNLIPKMIPGTINGEPVTVPYSLPLKIQMTQSKDNVIATYPVFRGCDEHSSNDILEKCSKEKITNYIKMSFDMDLANHALPLEKSTQFLLDFIINKKGKVEHVNAKANHRAIAIEAIKVAKRLPKFKVPGTVNGKPVETPYSLLMTLYFQ